MSDDQHTRDTSLGSLDFSAKSLLTFEIERHELLITSVYEGEYYKHRY